MWIFCAKNIMLNTGHVYIHIAIILIHLNLEQQHLTLEKSTCHLFRRYLLCACVWLSFCLCAIVRSELNFTKIHFISFLGFEWDWVIHFISIACISNNGLQRWDVSTKDKRTIRRPLLVCRCWVIYLCWNEESFVPFLCDVPYGIPFMNSLPNDI